MKKILYGLIAVSLVVGIWVGLGLEVFWTRVSWEHYYSPKEEDMKSFKKKLDTDGTEYTVDKDGHIWYLPEYDSNPNSNELEPKSEMNSFESEE